MTTLCQSDFDDDGDVWLASEREREREERYLTGVLEGGKAREDEDRMVQLRTEEDP